MKKPTIFLSTLLFIVTFSPLALASESKGTLGVGLELGDPSGLTIKYWTSRRTAFDGYIGGSYFGSTRIGVDYLWHYPVRESNIVHFYAGLGGTIGFGNGHGILWNYNTENFYYRTNNGIGLGARGLAGISVEPHTVPLEFFFELGLLLGVTPNFGSAFEAGIGLRFYP
jgi:hypothetical protein